jgi:reductive dehalogenase
LEIPEAFAHAIVLIHEMNYELLKTSPTYTESAATGFGYSMMAFVAGSLAHYIRTLGYRAMPCGNDTALSIPMAIDAGLGELGRNGLLITEKFGPRVRISKVLTDLPLVPDKPVAFGVKRFCDTCKRCAEDCPGTAIPDGNPTQEAPSESNNPGTYKWYVHPERCFSFWGRHRGGCGNCIRACPYNKPLGLVHDLVRSVTKHVPMLDPLWVKVDTYLGYGRKARADIQESTG